MALLASVLTLAATTLSGDIHDIQIGLDPSKRLEISGAIQVLPRKVAISSRKSSSLALRHRRLGRPRRHIIRLPFDYGAWTRVADCESGGWLVRGGLYPDPLGISAANWALFGGGPPQPAGPSTRRQIIRAIRVADRIRRRYGISIPDGDGCAPW